MKPISILTSTPPGSAGVGDIYLSNIVENCDLEFRSRISLVRNASKSQPFWNKLKSHVFQVGGSGFPVVREFYFFLFVWFRLKKVSSEIAQLLDEEGVKKLWVTLSSAEVILVAERLSQIHSIQIFSTIWDVPEYFLGRQTAWSCRRRIQTLKAYEKVLRASLRISCISEGMCDYVTESGVVQEKLRVIRNGVSDPAPEKSCVVNHEIQRIVFVGSLYAKDEWNALVTALECADFMVDGVMVELIHVGRFPRYGAKRSPRISFLGVLSQSEVLALMTASDIGYLPYWMNPDKSLIVQTSFPGKLSTYVNTGARTLFHGPVNSSVVQFFEVYPVGLACGSLNHKDIIGCIEAIMHLDVDQQVMERARKSLSVEKMAADFMEFIQ